MPRKVPAWKEKAKGSDLSPKEIQWQDKQRAATLAANASARQARQAKAQDQNEIPEDVAEWFDRCRIAMLASIDEGATKKKPNTGTDDTDIAGAEVGAGLSGLGSQAHRLYISTKFEKRGLTLYSILRQFLAGKKWEEKLMDAHKLLRKELSGGVVGDDGGNVQMPHLRVVSVGGGPGTDAAAMLWISRHFLRSRAISCCLLDSDTRWRRQLPTLRKQLQGAQLLPALDLSFETFDPACPLAMDEDPNRKNGKSENKSRFVDIIEKQSRSCAGDEEASNTAHDFIEYTSEDVQTQASRNPNSKAASALFSADNPLVDLFLVSYACFEAHATAKSAGWVFFRDLAVRARPGAVILFVDVQHRSREVLEEVYEAMLSALEALAPKGRDAYAPKDIMDMSDSALQGLLLEGGPSHQAIERRFRQLSLCAHPDKHPEQQHTAQEAFTRLQSVREAVIRGHELVKQADGGVLIMPLASSVEGADGPGGARDGRGLLLRYDMPPSAQAKAEVMLLIKTASVAAAG